MKLFTAQQIREIDDDTIQHEPVTSINLMERAALACFDALKEKLKKTDCIAVFCGMGNNGGDGLAITRMLLQNGFSATAYRIKHSENASTNNTINLKRLMDAFPKHIQEIANADALHVVSKLHHTIVVDALLGTGITKKTEGLLAQTIHVINAYPSITIYSIDVPSGLFCDAVSEKEGSIVKADVVLTFQFPKLAFLMAENEAYVKSFLVLDIRLHPDAIAKYASPFHYISRDLITALLTHRSKFSHKGSFGHGLLLAGCRGKSGAALIAAKACMKSGAGLLTVHSTKATLNALLQNLPEAMSSADTNLEYISEINHPEKFDAIAFGPGVGLHEDTQRVLKKILQYATGGLIIDADGLNILSENKTWLNFLPPNTILTPHVKEFDRLCMNHSSDFERLVSLRKFSAQYRCIVVLKSAHTAISMPDGTVFFNSTGNPGLAKAGSGDGLTGILLGLLCRTYTPAQAALIGVYLHGLAADSCSKKMSMESMLISDVIEELPSVFLELEKTAVL
jgi:ADP-dependent NAD(P)H-hydrate dehydratase / NAD(P)H-hydrate epimerase